MAEHVELQHDGFGRRTLIRRLSLIQGVTRTCAWCGQKRTRKGSRYFDDALLAQRLFQYMWVGDDHNGPLMWPKNTEEFCSISCWRAYTWQ